MKPWERYRAQQQPAPEAAAPRGPWERYRQQQPPAGQQAGWAPDQSPHDFVGLPGFEDMQVEAATTPAPAPTRQPGRQGLADDMARGAGLTARTLLSPVTGITDAVGGLVLGDDYYPLSRRLTDLGLPEPATTGERLVSAVGEGAAGAAAGVGLGRLLLGAGSAGARAVGGLLAEAPAAQLAGGSGAGGASQVAAEADAHPVLQLALGVSGGYASGAPFLPRTPQAPQLRLHALLDPSSTRPDIPVADAPAGAVTTADRAIALRDRATNLEQPVRRAAESAGLDWNTLDEGLRAQITNNVIRAMQTQDLPPEAAARAAFYESLGLTPTRGMATRSLVDTQAEGVAKMAGFEENNPLRLIDAQNNAAFRQRIQELAPEGVAAVDAPTFGQAFRAPLAEGERRAQRVTSRAYQRAIDVEGGREAPVDQLNQFLADNAGTLNNRPASAGLVDDLKKLGLLHNDWRAPGSMPFQLGDVVDKPTRFTLRNLSAARAAVNEAWDTAKRTGDTRAANRLSELRRIMDDAEAAAGGELFKAYRQLRVKKGGRYEDNPLIDRLISDRKGYYGTDLIEDSEVFNKAVLGSSTEQFAKVWPRLTPKAKDLTRAQVAKYLEERAFSNMGRNEQADPVASAAKLSQALGRINPQKLDLIFGKEKAQQLQSLNRALIEISNPPAGSIPAGSAPAIMQLASSIFRVMGRVMGGGTSVINDAASGLVSAARSGAQNRRNAEVARRAIHFLPMPQQTASGAVTNRLLQLAAPTAFGSAAVQE